MLMLLIVGMVLHLVIVAILITAFIEVVHIF